MENAESLPLNKYLAQAGVGSRRAVIDLVDQRKVTVNGVTVTNPAHRINPHDIVICDGKHVIPEKKVYLLFNKPTNCITTTHDEHNRKTVIDSIAEHYKVRLYPVGRLDRDTTGVLLLTNDGQLAQCLAHPKYEVKKTYHATLDRIFRITDERSLQKGVMLDDGLIVPDNVTTLADSHRRIVSVTLHSGKYHVVRRIFDALEYTVTGLDRAVYAGLTKQGVRPGAWRSLTHQEIERLKKLSTL